VKKANRELELYTELEYIEWSETSDGPADVVKVGDLRLFRYVDADAYDSAYHEVFHGPIVSIRLDNREEMCVFHVLCQDAVLRTFSAFELWGETLEEYGSRLREEAGAPERFLTK